MDDSGTTGATGIVKDGSICVFNEEENNFKSLSEDGSKILRNSILNAKPNSNINVKRRNYTRNEYIPAFQDSQRFYYLIPRTSRSKASASCASKDANPIEIIQNRGYGFLIAYERAPTSKNLNPGREYYLFKHVNNYIHEILSNGEKDYLLYCHEIILDFIPIKMYFDIDFGRDKINRINPEYFKKDNIYYLIELIIDTIIQIFPQVKPDNFSLWTRFRDDKYGCHLILDKWYINNVYHAKALFNKILETNQELNSLRIMYPDVIDEGVYSKNHSLRLPQNMSRELKIKYKPELVKYKGKNYFPDLEDYREDGLTDELLSNRMMIEILKRGIITCTDNCKQLPIEIEERHFNTKKEFTDDFLGQIAEEIYDRSKYLKSQFEFQGIYGDIIRFKRLRGEENNIKCIICNNDLNPHTGIGCYLKISKDQIFFKCYRNTRAGFLIGTIYDGKVQHVFEPTSSCANEDNSHEAKNDKINTDNNVVKLPIRKDIPNLRNILSGDSLSDASRLLMKDYPAAQDPAGEIISQGDLNRNLTVWEIFTTNYIPEDLEEEDFNQDLHEKLSHSLALDKWVYHFEEVEGTNIKRWRIRVRLCKKMRGSTVVGILRDYRFTNFQVKSNTTKNPKEFDYKFKEKGFKVIKGPYTDKCKEIPWQLKGIKPKPYWNEIYESANDLNDRWIDFVVDIEGGNYKSLCCLYGDFFGYGKIIDYSSDYKDIMRQVNNIGESKLYFVDLARGLQFTDKNFSGFYSALEQVKNGRVSDDRFKYKTTIMGSPRIWVFLNSIPQKHLLSKDRIRMWQIDPETLKLKPYKD